MKLKRLAAVLLAICVTVSCFPISALQVMAEEISVAEVLSAEAADTVPEGLEYEIVDGAVTITDYNNKAREIVIPEKIEGLPVTSIGFYAFYECDRLTRIVLPESITSIDNGAFACCTRLEQINIPAGVISLGDTVFLECENLQSISIPEGITRLGSSLFSGCSSLQEIAIPENVTSIGHDAFRGCTFSSVEIPDGVTSIEGAVFAHCSALESITIPESVTSIGNHAFYGCSKLKSITIPKGITRIHASTFYECDGIEIWFMSDAPVIDGTAFASATEVTAYYPANNPTWTKDVKRSYGGLVTWKAKGETACEHTWRDAACYVPKRCSSCGETEGEALLHGYENGVCTVCGMIEGLQCAIYEEDIEITDYTGTAAEIVIPEKIGGLPITCIGDSAFYNCDTVKHIMLPDTITSIGNNAFSYSEKLESVILPKNITYISEKAFMVCQNLKSVTLPESITNIGEYAFHGCKSLENITLPEGITKIAGRTFQGCTGLKSITIPKNVASIEDCAFYECKGIEVRFMGNAPEINIGAFKETENIVAIYPAGNSVWKEAIKKYYGTRVTWKAVCYGEHIWKEAACTEPKTCSVCGETESDTVGHKYQNGKCTVCGDSAMKLITKPKTAHARLGESAKVTLKVSGEGLTYTWYYKNADSSSYKKETAFKGSTYGVTMIDSVKDRRVYCIIKDKYGNEIKTDPVYLRMAATVMTQPTDPYAQDGKSAKITFEVIGDGLKYTWYYKNPGSEKFLKSTITKPTYSITMNESRHGRQVYCKVTDKYGNEAETQAVTLRMAATITTQPKTTCAKLNYTAKLSVSALGEGLKYAWYYKNPGETKFTKSTNTSKTYSSAMTSARNGRQVYCVVTDRFGKTAKSNTVYLRMAATITTQPKNVTAANGSKAKVKVGAVGDELRYVWYYKDPGKTKFTKSTVTGSEYSVTMNASRNGRQVYCKVYDKYDKVAKSDTVTLKKK